MFIFFVALFGLIFSFFLLIPLFMVLIGLASVWVLVPWVRPADPHRIHQQENEHG